MARTNERSVDSSATGLCLALAVAGKGALRIEAASLSHGPAGLRWQRGGLH